jgi:thiamine-phosphate pyrophosphorylase
VTAITMSEVAGAPTIILITDPGYSLARVVDVVERVGSVLPGMLLVQLRDKLADPRALFPSARALREATTHSGARFVVNAPSASFLHVARDVGADGAHVPAALIDEARAIVGPSAWISTPAHTEDDVAFAARVRASAALVSPIWESPGKGPARGTAALRAAHTIASRASSTEKPMWTYALGGVDESRAAACADAGADGIAVIRALLDAEDPSKVARLLDAPFQDRRRAVCRELGRRG